MLLHTPSHMHDRFTPTSTEAREEARNIKPDKTEAWKRRRNKPWLNHQSIRPTPESPVLLHRSLRTDPINCPRTVSTPLRRRHRRQTGATGPDRSLRPTTPESTAHKMGLHAASWAFGPCTPLAHPNSSFMPKVPLFMWLAYK